MNLSPSLTNGVTSSPARSHASLEDDSGKYFEGMEEGASSQESYDLQKAAELWEASAELMKLQLVETVLRVKDAWDEAI